MQNNYVGRKQAFPILALLSVIFIYTSSTFLRSQYNFYLAFAAYVGFFCITACLRHKWRFNKTYVWAALATLACFVYYFGGAADKITTYLSGIIYITFWFNVFGYLSDNYDRKTIACFAVINIVILLTNILTTIDVLQVYPLAARAINGKAEGITDQDVAMYTDMGCGGFGFIYGSVFLSLGLSAAFRSKQISVKMRLFSIAVYVLIFYMILVAEFTTALLLTIIMLLFSIVMKSKRLHINVVIVGLISLIIVWFHKDMLDLVKSVAERFNVEYVVNKMDMLISASNNDSVGNLSRTQRYMESINGFLQNPLIGSGTAGNHSQIIDTFSAIGLFALPYVFLLFSVFSCMKKYIDVKYVLVFSIGVLILAILNPFVDSTVISLTFMLVPTLFYCFMPKETNG